MASNILNRKPNFDYIFELPLGFTRSRPPKTNGTLRRIFDREASQFSPSSPSLSTTSFIIFTEAQLRALNEFTYVTSPPQRHQGIIFKVRKLHSESREEIGHLVPALRNKERPALPKTDAPLRQSEIVPFEDNSQEEETGKVSVVSQMEPGEFESFFPIYIFNAALEGAVLYDGETVKSYAPHPVPVKRTDSLTFGEASKNTPTHRHSWFNPVAPQNIKNNLGTIAPLKYLNPQQKYCFFAFKKSPQNCDMMVSQLLECMCQADHIPHIVLERMMQDGFQVEHEREMRQAVPNLYELALNHFHVEFVINLASRARQDE